MIYKDIHTRYTIKGIRRIPDSVEITGMYIFRRYPHSDVDTIYRMTDIPDQIYQLAMAETKRTEDRINLIEEMIFKGL